MVALVVGSLVLLRGGATETSAGGAGSPSGSRRITVIVDVESRQIADACVVTTNNVFGSYPVNGANDDTMVPLDFPNGESYRGLDVVLPWHGRLAPYNKDAGLNVAVYPVTCSEAVTRLPTPTDISCDISLSNNSPGNTHIDFDQSTHTASQNPQGNDGTTFCWIPPAGAPAITPTAPTTSPMPLPDRSGSSAVTECTYDGIADILRQEVASGAVVSADQSSNIEVNCQDDYVGILYQGYDGMTQMILARQSDGAVLEAGANIFDALFNRLDRATLSNLFPGQFGHGA